MPIENAKPKDLSHFTFCEDKEDMKKAFASIGEPKSARSSIMPTGGQSFRDLIPDGSARQPFSRADYSYFRPNERLPETIEEVIAFCMLAYKKNPILKNVIDLMSDFACKGVRIICENKKEQNFYRQWFKKVSGKNRSERFLSLFYRAGNVFIRRMLGRIKGAEKRQLMRTDGETDLPPEEEYKPEKNEIPHRYLFLNPLIVQPIVSSEFSTLITKREYGLKLPKKGKYSGRTLSVNDQEQLQDILNQLPAEVRKAVINGDKIVRLDADKLRTFFYKKDDWEFLAEPMAGAILDDLIALQKLKLADLAALDGVMSNIRLWKLGDLENKIMPTAEGINKLTELLLSNTGGGTLDIVWGPAIALEQTKTQAYEFLKSEKYEATLTSIYAGLGVPPTLTGSSQNGGYTNNFISIKTLVERLEYGREALTEFWEGELKLLKQAMGFTTPGRIVYDHMTLSDENAEKKLYMDMMDRGIISPETVVERFGEIPEIEVSRLKKDKKLRNRKIMPSRSGPFADPEQKLLELAFQSGAIKNEDVGLPPAPPGFSMQPKGQPGQGRPLNSKDKTKRKTKVVKPRGAANIATADFIDNLFEAEKLQKKISDYFNDIYLGMLNKKTLRELTDEESKTLEEAKFFIMLNSGGVDIISEDVLLRMLKPINPFDSSTYNKLLDGFIKRFNEEPDTNARKKLQAMTYAIKMVKEE
jgi:hypothetical protein